MKLTKVISRITPSGGCSGRWFLTFIALLTMAAQTAWADLTVQFPIYTGDEGTEAKPYKIKTTDDLDKLAADVNSGTSYEGKYFVLGDDITYTHTTDWNNATSEENIFTAIGTGPRPFRGIFDGQGHTIRGIRICTANFCQGLFGNNCGTVRNVILDDAHITGQENVGGIAGLNDGTIENCHVTANVLIGDTGADPHFSGGIAGYNKNGTVNGCTSSSTLRTSAPSGGVVCFNEGLVMNCLAIGVIIEGHSGSAITVINGGTLSHNYYYNIKKGSNYETYNVGCSGYDITDNDGAVPATILYETQEFMPDLDEDEKVVFRREFTKDKASTVCLPFDIDADQAAAAGKFYTFVGVDKTGPDWEVIMQEANATANTLSANTPYLFVPKATGPVLFYGTVPASIALVDQTPDVTTYPNAAGWRFRGSYTLLEYGFELQGDVYGFAASNYDGDGYKVSPGDFVKAISGATFLPFRSYLKYSDGSSTRGTSGSEALPSKIAVRLIGAVGGTTGIGEKVIVNSEKVTTAEGWHDLSGRRLAGQPTAKGIYIHNGKKVFKY